MSGSTPSTGISTAATPQTNNPATSEVPVNTPTETPDIDFRAANADADPLAAVTAEPPTASPTGGATTGTD
ncbi:MAG: hypothetical protein LBO75_00745, partial [Bifidobacteriaceae bacterium]|nr:hypothetical protein [Bifidobacteriaceae bacterium]